MFSDLDFLDGFINIIETSQKEVEKTFENTKELSFSIEKDISKKVYINDIKKLEKLSYALSKNSIFSVKRTYSFNKKDMADNLDYNFELISTINLNANSINQYISSDGNTKSTVLDLEIQKEISKMKNHPCKNIFIDKIISSINIFFSDSNKNILDLLWNIIYIYFLIIKQGYPRNNYTIHHNSQTIFNKIVNICNS